MCIHVAIAMFVLVICWWETHIRPIASVYYTMLITDNIYGAKSQLSNGQVTFWSTKHASCVHVSVLLLHKLYYAGDCYTLGLGIISSCQEFKVCFRLIRFPYLKNFRS